jgi:hypothetical protein
MIAYKFLAPGAVGPFSGFAWGEPGRWVEADGEPAACRSGIHACRVEQLPYWLGEELWEIELDGEVVEAERKLVAARGRLRERLDSWPAAAAELAADCVARCRELAGGDEVLAGYADDAALYESRGDVPCVAYIAAHAAGRAGGPGGLTAERERQAAWIAERLGLAAP